jgi:hypothetical protein
LTHAGAFHAVSNNANKTLFEAYLDKDGWKIKNSKGEVINSGFYLDPFTVPDKLFPGHYFKGGNSTYGNYQTDPMIGTTSDSDLEAFFRNVFGNGSRQAYRLTIKPLLVPISD